MPTNQLIEEVKRKLFVERSRAGIPLDDEQAAFVESFLEKSINSAIALDKKELAERIEKVLQEYKEDDRLKVIWIHIKDLLIK